MMDDDRIFVEGKELRCGYTTGTCAAAASKAASIMLLGGDRINSVVIIVPSGKELCLGIEDITITNDQVICAVKKDGGDDIDVTDGTLIYSAVRKRDDGKIILDGGEGVGRVTRKGLDQPIGNAAINRIPRSMILEAMNDAAESFGWKGGLEATIQVPDGAEIAKRTFNPNLGIVGGISILGTSGIVRPMSEKALVDTIRTEMRMYFAEGHRYLLFVPGNYGQDYSDNMDDIGSAVAVKISNFLGESLDYAVELGVEGILLVGNIGKLVKVAGGIMNTHSRNADCRMEILSAYTVVAGGDADTARKIMDAVTTEAALDILKEAGLMNKVMYLLAERIEFHMMHRVGGKLKVGAVMFSSTYGRLCESGNASDIMKELM
ncbi:MAG: cobalt-precorrin-5B (C(1))-methyltransferase CbiD [Candidatus Methanogranum gryphiswaldense]|nr:MAG: cobalt-precorrin-5B (C(1))-methyltransferase CbiD [Candidatus Methanogranum sp. U3.2.1]